MDAREAFAAARAAGDVEQMAAAALRLPADQRFGAHPGLVPALVHEAYRQVTDEPTRARLAAALARAWVYGGEPADRAGEFAAEALALAERVGDPLLVADALDAGLVAHWGPDDFAERIRLAARLTEAAAFVADPEIRLATHLWRLTTAWECLDVIAVQRQLRALDVLAADHPDGRARFFATARRASFVLTTGDLAAADELIAATKAVDCSEPDVEAVIHSLDAGRAHRAGDVAALACEAAAFEEYGAAEGIPSVSAEAAVHWLAAGEPERAGALLDRTSIDAVPHDVDFLLTVCSLTAVAAALRRDDIAAEGARQLVPYAGRAVLNAGAVTFHGVVEDYVYRAHRALGRDDAARWRDAAVNGYRRIGAQWWENRLGAPVMSKRQAHLRVDPAGIWTVGYDGATFVLPDLKGLHHLRELLRNPGVEIAAAALGGSAPPESDAGEVIDAQALAAYRNRLRDIDGELADAQGATADRLRLEREALLDEVAAATGLGGRRRRVGGTGERARSAVRKAIAAALDRIDGRDAAFARLLRDTVRTGSVCCYDPDPARPVSWSL